MTILTGSGLSVLGVGSSSPSRAALSKAKKGTAQSIVPDVAETIVFDNVVFNDEDRYNLLTGVYTADRSGDYLISSSVTTLGSWSEGERQVLEVHINGTLSTYLDSHQFYADTISPVLLQTSGTDIYRLVVGDTVEVKLYHDRGIALDLAENGEGQIAGELNYISVEKIADAELDTQLTQTSRSIYFSNETEIDVPFVGDSYPSIQTFIYDSDSPLEDLSIVVQDSLGEFTGNYNSIGTVQVDNQGLWRNLSTQNTFKLESEDKYIAFCEFTDCWVIFEAINDHNNIDSRAYDTAISINSTGTLPESFGRFNITTNLDNIDTTRLILANPEVILDNTDKTITLEFNTAQSGLIIYK